MAQATAVIQVGARVARRQATAAREPLQAAGLSDGAAGLQLVDGLARAYRLPSAAGAAFGSLDVDSRLAWTRALTRVRPRGLVQLTGRQVQQATSIRAMAAGGRCG